MLIKGRNSLKAPKTTSLDKDGLTYPLTVVP